MFTIQDHRLFYPSDCSNTPLLHWTPSPHFDQHRTIIPQVVVIHYTAGASAASTADWCALPESRVSYHVIIDRDGSIYQLVAFNHRAWHAGRSQWDGHQDVNTFSIGVALANFGWMPEEEHYKPRTDFLTILAGHKHDPLTLRAWETYPRAQLLTLTALIAALDEAYPIRAVVGHDDIAPGRKVDPGPAFYPLPALVDRDVAHPLFALLDHNPQSFQIPE